MVNKKTQSKSKKNSKKARNKNSVILPLMMVAISTVILSSVYIAEYGYGYLPCELCLYQRYTWFAIGIFSLFSLFVKPLRIVIRPVAILTTITGAAIAGFHFGVEQLWWQGLSSCGGSVLPSEPIDMESLLLSIEQDIMPSCDVATWVFLGLSMTGYNGLMNLSVLALVLFYKKK